MRYNNDMKNEEPQAVTLHYQLDTKIDTIREEDDNQDSDDEIKQKPNELKNLIFQALGTDSPKSSAAA